MKDIHTLQVLVAVAIVLFVIATFFLINSLKKIEQIPIIEVKMQGTLAKLAEILERLERVVDRSHEHEARLNSLEGDMERIEDRIDNLY